MAPDHQTGVRFLVLPRRTIFENSYALGKGSRYDARVEHDVRLRYEGLMSGLKGGKTTMLRAKTYANKADKEVGTVGHLQVAGPIADFEALLKGDAEAKKLFEKIVSDAIKATK